MKAKSFKRHLMTIAFMLFCIGINAADDLITSQITIKLDEAGTLPTKIGDSRKYKITNLKIIGDINGSDVRLIRDMAGSDYDGGKTSGNLHTLDLSEANIVQGGNYYFLNKEASYTENNEISKYFFYNCSELTSITIPSSVTSIGEYAFYNCSGLTSITIPSSATSIGEYTFYNCSELTSITIPSSVTSIGECAFYNCYRLTSITIPSGVTSIGGSAFFGCSGLTSITIPSGVTSIGGSTFSCCSGLTSITIPSGVTSIGGYAFSCCSGLTSITIPSGVTSIGRCAFSGCSGLTSIYVSWNTPLYISSSVFYNVDKKACTLYIPKGTYQEYWLSNWGEFENIIEYDPTGIDKPSAETELKEISRNAANGTLLKVPTKGLNIVRYSDGSVIKEMVK